MSTNEIQRTPAPQLLIDDPYADGRDRDDAQLARHMQRTPRGFQLLLDDPSEEAATLARRVLRGLLWLRRNEHQADPSDRTNGGAP